MVGLKKKYIQAAKGSFKRAWALQKAASKKTKFARKSQSPKKQTKGGSRKMGSKKINIPIVGIMAGSRIARNVLASEYDVMAAVANRDFSLALRRFDANVQAKGLESAIIVAGYALAKGFLPRRGINLGPIRITV